MRDVFRSLLGAAIGLASLGPGCAEPLSNKGEGESCTRAVQCEPGLACVEGECSRDPDPLTGTVPDGGNRGDAGPMDGDDGGPAFPDGATPPDAGGGMDSGSGAEDAGDGTMDAGGTDAGGTDAGSGTADAGDAAMDAGGTDGGDGTDAATDAATDSSP